MDKQPLAGTPYDALTPRTLTPNTSQLWKQAEQLWLIKPWGAKQKTPHIWTISPHSWRVGLASSTSNSSKGLLYIFIWVILFMSQGLPSGEESACQCRRHRLDPWVGKIPWRRKWQPAPVFLPGKFHGQRSLVDYRPRGRKESDMTKYTHTHTHTYLCPK